MQTSIDWTAAGGLAAVIGGVFAIIFVPVYKYVERTKDSHAKLRGEVEVIKRDQAETKLEIAAIRNDHSFLQAGLSSVMEMVGRIETNVKWLVKGAGGPGDA